MNKFILLLFFTFGISFAWQQDGFIRFESSESWVVKLNDSLDVKTNQVYPLSPGKYFFKARPAISYSWPSIVVIDSMNVFSGDTTVFKLKQAEYLEEQKILSSTITKPILYSEKDYIPKYENKNSIKTTLIISAVTANWISFYLKRRADSYYENYQSSSNLKKINHYYDQTKLYDNLSGIMLGVSVAALSTYIYFTLAE